MRAKITNEAMYNYYKFHKEEEDPFKLIDTDKFNNIVKRNNNFNLLFKSNIKIASLMSSDDINYFFLEKFDKSPCKDIIKKYVRIFVPVPETIYRNCEEWYVCFKCPNCSYSKSVCINLNTSLHEFSLFYNISCKYCYKNFKFEYVPQIIRKKYFNKISVTEALCLMFEYHDRPISDIAMQVAQELTFSS